MSQVQGKHLNLLSAFDVQETLIIEQVVIMVEKNQIP